MKTAYFTPFFILLFCMFSAKVSSALPITSPINEEVAKCKITVGLEEFKKHFDSLTTSQKVIIGQWYGISGSTLQTPDRIILGMAEAKKISIKQATELVYDQYAEAVVKVAGLIENASVTIDDTFVKFRQNCSGIFSEHELNVLNKLIEKGGYERGVLIEIEKELNLPPNSASSIYKSIMIKISYFPQLIEQEAAQLAAIKLAPGITPSEIKFAEFYLTRLPDGRHPTLGEAMRFLEEFEKNQGIIQRAITDYHSSGKSFWRRNIQSKVPIIKEMKNIKLVEEINLLNEYYNYLTPLEKEALSNKIREGKIKAHTKLANAYRNAVDKVKGLVIKGISPTLYEPPATAKELFDPRQTNQGFGSRAVRSSRTTHIFAFLPIFIGPLADWREQRAEEIRRSELGKIMEKYRNNLDSLTDVVLDFLSQSTRIDRNGLEIQSGNIHLCLQMKDPAGCVANVLSDNFNYQTLTEYDRVVISEYGEKIKRIYSGMENAQKQSEKQRRIFYSLPGT